jgi:NADPH:quinone reductase-like Zn-dependent oxidoreductase
MSFADAASFPTVAHTIVQSLTRADAELKGGLKGKTVLVPAGLSGTGSLALQLLKSVFGVGKLITTVSTSKVALVPELLGQGVVDQIIDYKTQNVVKEIGRGSVDFLLDTAFTSMSFLPVLKPETGLILTITGKSGTSLAHDWPEVSWLLVRFLNGLDALYTWRASRWGVTYHHIFIRPLKADLDLLAEWLKDGKAKAVIGAKLKMKDLEEVKKVCGLVYAGKGGIGKYVIEVE